MICGRRVPMPLSRTRLGSSGASITCSRGRSRRVDSGLLQTLIEHDIVPVIPIGIDGTGNSFRLNSDAVAVEIAKTLRAVKLVYPNTEGGIRCGRTASCGR
ncbi:MAG: hypothetical protein U0792_13985 [Gemmataceae bacterium]